MSIDWRPFVDLVARHQRFLLTTHVRPDGDGLGSQRALTAALRRLGKDVRVVNASPVPDRYDFLDPQREFQKFIPPGDELRSTEVLVVMDTGTWNQLASMAEFVKSLAVQKVVIDHHPTQDDLGARRLVDTAAEATGRLTYQAIRALGVGLTPEIANALFAALAMDTGWFRHSNATAATFALASELTQAGAHPDYLYQLLYERNTLPRLKLMGRVLDRMVVEADGRLAYSAIHRADYATTGATPQDSEDLVNYGLSMTAVEVGLLFMEQLRGGVKVSFRSRNGVDVGKVAEHFGGGGHRQAAGAIVDAPLVEVQSRVLQAINAVLHI